MASRRSLATRFFSMAKFPFSSHNHSLIKKKNNYYPKEEEEESTGFIRRLFFQSAMPSEGLHSSHILPRIQGLGGMLPLNKIPKGVEKRAVSIEETKKVMWAVQLEAVRARLRALAKSYISYSEFVEICCEGRAFEQGMRVAKILDESGDVIMLGNIVFLRPDEVARAIESLIPLSTQNQNDPKENELKAMEAKKAMIDEEAKSLVKKELWCGLGIFLLQTAGFMRLTFWELSWDVMEPVCFFVTSFYFMAGYAFFLRTSRDPSFEGFFQSRFDAKQKRLMKMYRFDMNNFNELKKACHGPSSNPCCSCHQKDKTLLDVGH